MLFNLKLKKILIFGFPKTASFQIANTYLFN